MRCTHASHNPGWFQEGNQASRFYRTTGQFRGNYQNLVCSGVGGSQWKVIWAANLKKSNRGDSDSLNVTHDMAKTISKRIGKVMDKTSNASSKFI
jgi:hypothetical protein